MHSRRARPTVRVLREDLTSGWNSPEPQRLLAEGNLHALHPLNDLPHPILIKAAESFGDDPGSDHYVGPIASCRSLTLLEIKFSQWRAGVWIDEQGVCWILAAGLAKGDHQDWGDFYEQIRRAEETGGGMAAQKPTDEGLRLLKRETAAGLRLAWDLQVQEQVHTALLGIHSGGTTRLTVDHPIPGRGRMANVDLTIAQIRDGETDYDDVVVEIEPDSDWAGSDLLWSLIVRLLISVHPPEQGWDRVGNSFSNMGEPGRFTAREAELRRLVADRELDEVVEGQCAHRTHRTSLTDRTVSGNGARALCGVFFVPRQDHESLPECEVCSQRLAEIDR